jgi:hypothetical protein
MSPFTPMAPDPIRRFVELSVALTGFDRAELWGTGMVRPYYAALGGIVGERVVGQLLSEWASIAALAGGDAARLDALIESRLLADPLLGPVARNLTTLWYLGLWAQLPYEWSNEYGANARDVTHYVSGEAYRQGLVWGAIHVHPQGAKQPGFGSWSLPPQQGNEHG